ncbi:hypothetical protein S7711_11427 [Stachybotrys chartarum IBT 7711]|uniref:Uncharacterized protein n=1 Tax=Stachybotrys chartarum (strain CBS 109288 / IBT 7711) TaxID=1280523 RepID=A0A084B815_STACB|nr:hypothetical protein S7711_11427 [Stachybotrys chartarum IBT 7711]
MKLFDSLQVLQKKIPHWRQTLLATNIPKETIKEIIYNAEQQRNLHDIVVSTASLCHQLKTYHKVKGGHSNNQEGKKEPPLVLALETVHSITQQVSIQLLRDGYSDIITDLNSGLERIDGLIKVELDTTLLEFELRFRPGACTQIGKSLPPTPNIDLTSIAQASALYYYGCSIDYFGIIQRAQSSQESLSEYIHGMLDAVEVRKGLPSQPSSNLPHRIETLRRAFNSEKGSIGFASLPRQEYPQQNPQQMVLHHLGNLPVNYAVAMINIDELDDESFTIAITLIFGRLCGALCIWTPSIEQMSDLAQQLDNLVQIAIDVDEGEALDYCIN